jgi:hypothetical protein
VIGPATTDPASEVGHRRPGGPVAGTPSAQVRLMRTEVEGAKGGNVGRVGGLEGLPPSLH